MQFVISLYGLPRSEGYVERVLKVGEEIRQEIEKIMSTATEEGARNIDLFFVFQPSMVRTLPNKYQILVRVEQIGFLKWYPDQVRKYTKLYLEQALEEKIAII